MRRQSLTAKSGISNHAAADILDDPCLSRSGALLGVCPHKPAETILGWLCVCSRLYIAPLNKTITARSRSCLSCHLPYF